MRWRDFALGLFGGLGFSVIYYILIGTDVIPIRSPSWALGAVVLKLVGGITLLCQPRWKGVGLGLICSIPVAILIFVGVCFGLLATQ
jgi:hypothetical protein